jgi:N-acetylglucosaminyldiphosphoundecaprenol N-acetyl-beta-D-mannosaminyltransferase
MKTEMIMGIPVDKLTYTSILNDLPDYIEDGKKMTIISVNPQIVTESEKFPEVISLIKESTHRIPDGIGIVLVSKLTKGVIKERVAGFDLMMELLAYANTNGHSIFLYGAKPTVLTDTVKQVKQKYPNIKVAGAVDGYTDLPEEELVAQINQVKPDFLFVALGFPRQEQWLARNVNQLDVKVFQDVGGSFDVLSGHVKRAPQIFINLHLEWLYRSLSNPLRVGRIFQLPVFLVKSLIWKVSHRHDK